MIHLIKLKPHLIVNPITNYQGTVTLKIQTIYFNVFRCLSSIECSPIKKNRNHYQIESNQTKLAAAFIVLSNAFNLFNGR